MNVESSELITLSGVEDFRVRVLPMLNSILDANQNRYVMKIATKHYTLSQKFVEKLNARYYYTETMRMVGYIGHRSSNNPSSIESDEEVWKTFLEENGPKELELIKPAPVNYDFNLGGKREYNKARGAFFAYTHGFTDDYLIKTLECIGCFKELNMNNYKDNCFIIALKESQVVDSATIEHAKSLIQCSKISRSNLHKIVAFNPDIEILVTSDDGKRTTYKQKLNKKETKSENVKTVQLALIKDHYFLIFNTEITSYAIRNYDKLKNRDKWWQFSDDKHRRPDKRGMNTLNLIRELLKTDSLLTPIKPSEHITFALTNREKKLQDCNVYDSLEFPEEACRLKHAPRDYGFRYTKYMRQTLDSYFEGGTRAIKNKEEPKEEEVQEDEPQKKKQKKNSNTPSIGTSAKRSIKKHNKDFFVNKFITCGIGSIHAQNALL
eukprot:6178754-Pleurochrysis_carterae.AAC.7